MTDYADVIRETIAALAANGPEAARAVIKPIEGRIWWERLTYRRRSLAQSSAKPTGRRSFSIQRAAGTFARDGFVCYHCGIRVVARSVAVLIHGICSVEIPYNVHYKRGFTHELFWTNVAEADHLNPGSAGGSWDDLSNHVTACARCNAIKSDAEAARNAAANQRTAWDGAVGGYRAAWERAGRPAARYHQSWMSALERAVESTRLRDFAT